jgi:hypothetical protein
MDDMIRTPEELMTVPVGSVVRSARGTIACRADGEAGYLFGFEECFDWRNLTLPAEILYFADGTEPGGADPVDTGWVR